MEMRLERFLNEVIAEKDDVMEREKDPTLDHILTLIERDCKPFLKESKKLLFRGTKRKIEGIEKLTARTDRRPMDMPPPIHNALDNIFEQMFGWKARSQGVFVSQRAGVAAGYGSPAVFFPIGNYKYIWSPKIGDLFVDMSAPFGDEGIKMIAKSYGHASEAKSLKPEEFERLREWINKIYRGGDKGISGLATEAYSKEISFYCPNGYYLVTPVAVAELSYYLGMNR